MIGIHWTASRTLSLIRFHLGHLRKIKSRVAPNFQGSLMKRTALALSAAFISFPLAAQEQPTRPPITGIAHVRIYSTDLHKSADFYSRTLPAPARKGHCTSMTRPCLLFNHHQQFLFSKWPSPSPSTLLS